MDFYAGDLQKWMENFTDRELAEIAFSIRYVSEFNHGTDGHNAKVIISKMAMLLIDIEKKLGSGIWPTEEGQPA